MQSACWWGQPVLFFSIVTVIISVHLCLTKYIIYTQHHTAKFLYSFANGWQVV